MKIYTYFLVLLGFFCMSNIQHREYVNYTIDLPMLIDSLKIQKQHLSILIDKSEYKLSILAEDKVVKEYPVVFGGNAIDDKLMEGDRCTPEGSFKVLDSYPHRKWSKFIWIDYPTVQSWKKHNKAKADKQIPANAAIGGEIGIHGVPPGYDDAIDAKVNWTLGCISLKNEDVNEVYTTVFKGMVVKIVK